jgi:thioester reductase-like protein
MRVLVTGGVTGYLGQFVVSALQGSHEVQLLRGVYLSFKCSVIC